MYRFVGLRGLDKVLTPRRRTAWCRSHNALPRCLRRCAVVVVEKNCRQTLPHVPLHIVRQHAEKDMGFDPLVEPMVNRPHMQVDRLHRSETPAPPWPGPCRPAPCSPTTMPSAATEVRITYRPSNAASFAILCLVAAIAELLFVDLQDKVSSDLIMIEHFAHANADLLFAPQRLPAATRGRGDFLQLLLRGRQQFLPLAGTLSAKNGLRQTIKRSSGKSGEAISTRSRVSKSDGWIRPCEASSGCCRRARR